MVAGADNNHAFTLRSADIFLAKQRCSAFYLHLVLIEDRDDY